MSESTFCQLRPSSSGQLKNNTQRYLKELKLVELWCDSFGGKKTFLIPIFKPTWPKSGKTLVRKMVTYYGASSPLGHHVGPKEKRE